MAETPIVPPLRKPVSTYPTPSHVVAFYTELVNRDDPAYKANAPVKRGSIYSEMVGAKPEVIDSYPLLYFLRERQFQGNDQLVFWDWATDEDAHDTYNSEDTYALESIGHPGFTRVYTVRRELYEDDPFLVLGLPLTGLIGVRIDNGGGNYTQATGTIDGTDVAIDFVILDGVIISGVVTNEGTGVTGTSVITVTGDGGGAEVSPIVQSTASVLVAQKKQELDDQDPLQHEFIRIIRVYQTLPGPTIYTTRLDEDGITTTIATTTKAAKDIVTRETLLGGTWTKVTKKQTDNVYTAEETVETRVIPGNPIPSTRLEKDGIKTDVVRTMKQASTVVTQEQIIGNIWTRTHLEWLTERYAGGISDIVGWEVVEGRVIPGTPVPSSNVGADHETNLIEATIKDATTIVPGATEAGGTLTTVEQKEVTELVSEEIVTEKTWLDEALYVVSIENLIPREFRAFIPTVVESHTVAGIASQPTLGVGEFESSEKQLTEIFKEVRTTTLGGVVLPITHTNQELTELYGGGVLNVTYTLELLGTGTIDEGLLITTSTLLDLGNGMEIKETRELDGTAWPQLTGQDYDERLDVLIPYDQQVVDPGTGIGLAQTDVKPIDKWREEDRTIDATAAAAVLDAYLMTYPSKINVDMPDKLTIVEGIIETAAGEGTDTQLGTIAISATTYSIQNAVSASAQSSVTLSPDVALTIKQFWGNNIDSTHYHFFLPNPVTSADVLAKLNALLPDPVSAWPKFNPQIVTLFMYGEKRSLQVRATSGGSQAVQTSGNVSTSTGGVGYSIEVASSLRTTRISPTIHPVINLTGTTSDSRGISASAESEMEGLGPNEAISQSDTANANITPTTIDATEGATDWPTTGLYLYRVDAQPYRYGYVQFHVVVVDAADFPINP